MYDVDYAGAEEVGRQNAAAADTYRLEQENADLRGILELAENNGQAVTAENEKLREGIQLLEGDNAKLRELLNLALHDLSCTEAGSHTAGEIYAALDELDGTGDSE